MQLSGRTDLLSLFDLAQVLSVNEATGMLKVEQGGEKGYLYFDKGAIINALDSDRNEGEEAAKRVFAMRRAEFAFSADLPSVAQRITGSTQSLMMEIARALDEERASEGEASHVEEARQATEVLYELFHRLDSESKVLAHRSPQGFAVADLLGAIRGAPTSVLFLRAGAPPEVHAAGRVMPLGSVALDRPGYESLRDHLLREAAGVGETLDHDVDLVLRLSDEEAWRLETFRGQGSEVLSIRPLAPAHELPWGPEALGAALDVPGSVLAMGAPDPFALSAATFALASHLLARGSAPLVGWARRWPPALADGRAAVVLLSGADVGTGAAATDLADRLAPRVVLAEDADVTGALSFVLRAARRGAVGIVGVCAAPADRAPLRLLDGLDAADRPRFGVELSARLSAILATPAAGEPARVLEIDDAMRRALREGTPAAPRR